MLSCFHSLTYLVVFLNFGDANLFHSVLGIPGDCYYDNIILPCRLSFTCWLEGGYHVSGCGDNRWLFSCCIKKQTPIKIHIKNNHQNVMKKSILKRRTDERLSDCGIPSKANTKIQKRIIGGRPAKFAEYPWQAHIRIGEYQCGGVLVSHLFVATAAHCIQQARVRDISVYLGELDTQNSGKIQELLPTEHYLVSKKIIHPRFRYRLTQPDRYDLALLKLTKPAGYKTHIRPVCLPQSDQIGHPMKMVGRNAIIAGWGKTTASMGHTGTNILRIATVPILSSVECIKWHRSKDIHVEIYPEMFCAGHRDGHMDACLGDSGGPLTLFENGRYTLIGITSAGFGCGIDNQPGIYHSVQKTTKWIQNVIYQ